MRVLIVVKEGHENAMKLSMKVKDFLESKGGTVYFDRLTAGKLGVETGVDLKKAEADFVFVLGGDGTILWAESELEGRLRILGINFGSTGFLTEVRYRDWKVALERVLKDEYSIDERSKISVKVNGKNMGDALNEAVIKSSLPVEMLHLEIWVDGELAEVLRSDGIIISTPTGSTAYSMSAGGPIVDPRVNAFIITSICPFKLGARSIVVPNDANVSIRLVKPKKEAMLVIDGGLRKDLSFEDTIGFELSEKKTSFIKLEKDFYDRVKDRLER